MFLAISDSNYEKEILLTPHFYSPDNGPPPFSEEIKAHPSARDCSMPMGWTSENVAAEFDISRAEMDELAALSFQRAEKADKEGIFTNEIVPFTAYVNDPETGKRTTKLVTKDDGIRYGTTVETLSKVRPAFPQWGRAQTTGGNASQITDGAAAVMLMRRSKAEELGVKILGKHATTAVAGLAPRIMGIGPYYAIPMALELAGITKDDVDLWEVSVRRIVDTLNFTERFGQINEAFASQYAYCIKGLGLDVQKVNVNGGAIALGHPLDKYTGYRDRSSALILMHHGFSTVYRCPPDCDRLQRTESTTGQSKHVCYLCDSGSNTDVLFHMNRFW